jgi:hypothetical protein
MCKASLPNPRLRSVVGTPPSAGHNFNVKACAAPQKIIVPAPQRPESIRKRWFIRSEVIDSQKNLTAGFCHGADVCLPINSFCRPFYLPKRKTLPLQIAHDFFGIFFKPASFFKSGAA